MEQLFTCSLNMFANSAQSEYKKRSYTSSTDHSLQSLFPVTTSCLTTTDIGGCIGVVGAVGGAIFSGGIGGWRTSFFSLVWVDFDCFEEDLDKLPGCFDSFFSCEAEINVGGWHGFPGANKGACMMSPLAVVIGSTGRIGVAIDWAFGRGGL